MTTLEFRLVQDTPRLMNPDVHATINGKKLCNTLLTHPVSVARTEVESARELCTSCVVKLLERLGTHATTAEETLRVVRGDYDSQRPNAFWRQYGVTVWT